MTKSIKTILISALSCLLLILCVIWCALSTPVKADGGTPVNPSGYTKYDLTVGGGDFAFTEGAAISTMHEFTEDNMELGFQLNMITTKYENLLSLSSDKIDNNIYGAKLMGDQFVFKFTLYRCSKDSSSATALENIYVWFTYTSEDSSMEKIYLEQVIYREKKVFYDEEINLYGFDAYDTPYTKDEAISKLSKKFVVPEVVKTGFVSAGMIKSGSVFCYGTSGSIGVKTASPYTEYFVRFDYDFWVCHDDRILAQETNYDKHFTHYYPSVTDTNSLTMRQPADSRARSINAILTGMSNAGVLENYFNKDELSLANDILTNTEVKTIRVRYLKDIDGTPFAEMYEIALSVPVRNGKVNLVEVTQAIGKDNLHALSGKSIAVGLKENNEGVFLVDYEKSVWIRAFTEGKQYFDYFMDANLSYQAYYQPYVDAGVITEELAGYQFAKLVADFPALYGYQQNQIHGFFGLAMVPNNYDLNDAYKAIFGVDTVTVGIFNTFSYVRPSSMSEFNNLMKNYNFSWFKVLEAYTNIFTGLGDNFSANIFLFCADGETRELLIGQGGQDDPNDGGAVTEDNKGLIQKIKDFFDSSTGTLVDLGKDIGTSKAAIIIIAIVVLLVIVFIKTGLFSAIINGKFKRRK